MKPGTRRFLFSNRNLFVDIISGLIRVLSHKNTSTPKSTPSTPRSVTDVSIVNPQPALDILDDTEEIKHLYIQWNTGEMEIVLDRFFPTTQAKLRKLIDIIKLDYEHCDELVEGLRLYFQRAEKDYRRRNTEKEKFRKHIKTLETAFKLKGE